VTGAWVNDNTAALFVDFVAMAGSGQAAAAGSWLASSATGATGTINGVAAITDYMQVTGVVVLPGIELPSASRAPFIMRPFDQELQSFQRYYQKSYAYNQNPGTAIALSSSAIGIQLASGTSNPYIGSGYTLHAKMRATPSLTTYDCAGTASKIAARISATWTNGQAATIAAINEGAISVYATNIANCDAITYHYVCDARM
jgi:hypothetical protein